MNMNYNDNNIEIAINSLKALKEERQLRIQAEEQLEAQKGKVLFADAVSVSKESILIRDFAKELKQSGIEIGERRLYDWLRGNGYIMRQSCGRNLPTQRSMERGLIEIKETANINSYGYSTVTRTSKITPKGQAYFFEKIMEQKDIINGIEAEKQEERKKQRNEARRLKRQQQAV